MKKRSSRGRRGPYVVMDIGGTNFSVGLARADGSLLDRARCPTDRSGGPAWMLGRLAEEAHKLIQAAGKDVRGCGISFGGPVDFDRQVVRGSTHVRGWRDYPLSKKLARELQMPVVIDNDANVAALGEFHFGAGVDVQSLVFYTMSTGIGGGIILDGKPYRGRHGSAGELGHSPVWPAGPACPCGNRGCLEAVCSGDAIARRAREAVSRHPRRGKGMLKACGGRQKDLTARTVFSAAKAGDALALELVDETAYYLSKSVAMVFNVLDPDLVVLGGGVSLAGTQLLRPLRRHMKSHLFGNARKTAKVVTAKLRLNSGLLGALALAVETFE